MSLSNTQINEEDIEKIVEEKYETLKNSGRKLIITPKTNTTTIPPVIMEDPPTSEEIREEIMAEQETKKRIRESTDSIIVNVRKLLKIAGSSKTTLEEQLDAVEKLKMLERTIGIGVDPEPEEQQQEEAKKKSNPYANVASKFKEIDYHPPAEKKKIATGYGDEFVVQNANSAIKKKPSQYDNAKSRVFDIQPVPKEKTKRAELEEKRKQEQSKIMEFVSNDEALLTKLRESSKQAQKHLEKKNEEKKKKLDSLLEKLEEEEKKKKEEMKKKRKQAGNQKRKSSPNKQSAAQPQNEEETENQMEQAEDIENQTEEQQQAEEQQENTENAENQEEQPQESQNQ